MEQFQKILAWIGVKKSPAPPISDVASFAEIKMNFDQLKNSQGDTLGDYVRIASRLKDISLFDHHIAEEDRRSAAKLWDTITVLEISMSRSNPSYFESIREAHNFTLENAKLFGIGTVPWIMDEYGISEQDAVRVQNENVELKKLVEELNADKGALRELFSMYRK